VCVLSFVLVGKLNTEVYEGQVCAKEKGDEEYEQNFDEEPSIWKTKKQIRQD
jgi:hypothetical protein